MSNKKKKHRGLRIPNKMREMADIDYFDKLNAEDKDWLKDFIDAEYCNNHRKYEMYTEHHDYDRIKKEIYTRTNAVNTRCDYAKSKATNRLLSFDKYAVNPDTLGILEKMLHESIEDVDVDEMAKKMGIKTFEDSMYELLDQTVNELQSEYKDQRATLIRFYIKFKRLFSEERKQQRNDKKIAKGE